MFKPKLLLSVLLVFVIGLWALQARQAAVLAQEATPVLMQVNGFDPPIVVSGNGGTISVYGNGFTENSSVRIENVGVLDTEYIDRRTLRGTLPETLPPGEYHITVTDPNRGRDTADRIFFVNRPVEPTSEPLPTEFPTDLPTPTDVPTTVPGQPSLIARNFSTNPSAILPGDTTTVTFEVVNQGSRPALGVVVAVDPSGKFVPANGQSSAVLPDLPVGGLVTVTLSVVAAEDITAGAAGIPIIFSYHDFEGQAYTSNASLSVDVLANSQASQVTLSRYILDPSPVVPGEPVTIEVLVMNTGNATAYQVNLRVAGEGGLLLAGPEGDSFPLGDLAAGASTSIQVPMIVKSDVSAGPQPQPVQITFLQNGESQESAASMTIPVAEVVEPKPLLLLDSYDVGEDVLKPGDRFTLSMDLRNVGDADASNLLVTFGTVESSSEDDSGNDTTGGGGSSTNTTPSQTFAPLGGGGTIFAGTIEAGGGTLSLTQDFIVNGTVDSGIYSLPITLRYVEPNGDESQNNLHASIVVIAPPLLQTTLQSPLPEELNVGEPFQLSLEIKNNGEHNVVLTSAEVSAENGEVLDGATTPLTALASDADTTVTALVGAIDEGTVNIQVSLHYINDLNQPETLELNYTTEAVYAPPPDFVEPPPDFGGGEEVPTEVPSQQDLLGRLLLGLLGLGS